MDLKDNVRQLTEADREILLASMIDGMIEAAASNNPAAGEFYANSGQLQQQLAAAGESVGLNAPKALSDFPSDAKQRAELVLLLLDAIADSPQHSSRLQACLDRGRMTRVEPITMTLVLAGVVFLLSLDVKVKYSTENGKNSLEVSISKSPTDNDILKKFFSLF
jgi:hypothetical protein